jgi:hypothetical protein
MTSPLTDTSNFTLRMSRSPPPSSGIWAPTRNFAWALPPFDRSIGDSFDNATNCLYKTELIRGPGQGPWKNVDDVELATLA